ncbi:MAG TPA: hypothetical protein ENN29_11700 [Candidatus Hydrogenedentes bacterium]|nr:hypothetical protein [Candidatus Hydrogenedentota bacterium]
MESVLAPPETPYHRAFVYSLIAEGDASLECEFPDLPADAGQMEVRRLAQESEFNKDGTVRITQRYALDPIFPGQYVLPPLTVVWRSGGAEGLLATPPVAFHARELTAGEAEAAAVFEGIAPPDAVLPPPRVSTRLWLIMAGALVAAAAAVLAIRRFRRSPDAPEVAAPPWDVALNRLRELERRNLPGTGKIDAYYVDLSAILRYYIEDRFHIHAPEQTTPEFLDTAAQRRIFSEEQQHFLAEFLRQCDRVKFARLQPGMDDMDAHFKQVRHFIKDTMPRETEDAPLEEAA